MPEAPTTATGRALARAALAGNPSDTAGGAVLATVIPGLAAQVAVSPAERVVVGDRAWDDLPSLGAATDAGDGDLVGATVAHLASSIADGRGRPPDGGLRATWSTTIPRSVGLAGSSALVIAALRALAAWWDHPIDDVTGPRLALEVEVDRLGIAAGPQDRVVQWHGRTVLMDFSMSPWTVVPVDPPAPVEVFVAWTRGGGTPSDFTHRPLRDRRDDPSVSAAMDRLAALAREAAAALSAGDVARLGAAMDATYEERARLVDLRADHVALVEGARAAGASANYTGSGGAVVGVSRNGDLRRVRAWAEAGGHGFTTLTL